MNNGSQEQQAAHNERAMGEARNAQAESISAYEKGRRDGREEAAREREGLACMRTSREVAQLFAALAAARGEIGTILKENIARVTSAKGNYTYTYADLSAVVDEVSGPLSKNGLMLLQVPKTFPDKGMVRVSTVIVHSSGQWAEMWLDVECADFKPQTVGTAITYARRYSTMPLLNLAADDDDGAQAQGRQTSHERTAPRANAPRTEPLPASYQTRPDGKVVPVASAAGDDAWASVADQVVARILEVPSREALATLAKDIKALPESLRAKVKAQYDKRYRELVPPGAAS